MRAILSSAHGIRAAPSSEGCKPHAARCSVPRAIRARWCIDTKYGTKMEAVALLQEWVTGVASQAAGDLQSAAILSGNIGAPESRMELELQFESLSDLEIFWGTIPPQAHKAWSQRLQNVIIHGSPTWHVYRTVEVDVGPGPEAPQIEVPEPAASPVAPRRRVRRAPRVKLPDVAIPAGLPETSSGLSLVTSLEDALAILSSDQKFVETRLESDKATSNSRRASTDEADDGTDGPETSSAAADEDIFRMDASLPPRSVLEAAAASEGTRVGVLDADSQNDGLLRDWKGDPMVVNPGDKLPMKFL